MTFNFKKNLLIIILLVIVILSTIVYINIQNVKETFIPGDRINTENIIMEFPDTSYNYYVLNRSIAHYYLTDANVTTYLAEITGVTPSLNSFDTNDYLRTSKAATNYALIARSTGNTATAPVKLYKFKTTPVTLDISSVQKTSTSTSTRDTSSIVMVLVENSGNLYDLCNNRLSHVTIKINSTEIVKNGVFIMRPAAATATAATAGAGAATAGAAATPSTSTTIGDINISGLLGGGMNSLTGISNELFLYLLDRGAFGSSYTPPIYNNFETAMNLASNPIVNPVNSMNPLEYAQTLFGPGVTPMMSKNSTLNSDTKIAAGNSDGKSDGKSSTKDMFKFDADGNLLSQNIGNKNTDNNSNTSNCTKVNVDAKLLKEKCAPCPAPQRCPESNFECKKVPNYEQGIDNAFLPRPVLADFSTFGM